MSDRAVPAIGNGSTASRHLSWWQRRTLKGRLRTMSPAAAREALAALSARDYRRVACAVQQEARRTLRRLDREVAHLERNLSACYPWWLSDIAALQAIRGALARFAATYLSALPDRALPVEEDERIARQMQAQQDAIMQAARTAIERIGDRLLQAQAAGGRAPASAAHTREMQMLTAAVAVIVAEIGR